MQSSNEVDGIYLTFPFKLAYLFSELSGAGIANSANVFSLDEPSGTL